MVQEVILLREETLRAFHDFENRLDSPSTLALRKSSVVAEQGRDLPTPASESGKVPVFTPSAPLKQ